MPIKILKFGPVKNVLGDRPMSDPGHGPPIDSLDAVCKAYKDCIKVKF